MSRVKIFAEVSGQMESQGTYSQTEAIDKWGFTSDQMQDLTERAVRSVSTEIRGRKVIAEVFC